MTTPKKTDAERAAEELHMEELRAKFPKMYAALNRKRPPKRRTTLAPRNDSGNLPPAA